MAAPTEEEGFKMNVIRKIAVPCGIIGGVCTVLLSVFVFLVTPTQIGTTAVMRDETGQVLTSVTEKTFASGNLPFLIFTGITTAMGVLALVAVLSLKRRPQLRSVLMWVSVSTILTFGIFSLGLILLPASILLMLAAIGLREPGRFPGGE